MHVNCGGPLGSHSTLGPPRQKPSSPRPGYGDLSNRPIHAAPSGRSWTAGRSGITLEVQSPQYPRGDTFFWYGTSYKGNPTGLWGRKAAHLQQGFNCYRSKNLVDRKCEGVCFTFPKEGWLAYDDGHRTWHSQISSFVYIAGAAKMLHVQEWDPWKR